MKIISTFNDKIYEFSGKKMLESVKKHLPQAEIQIYEELERNTLDVDTIKLNSVPEFDEVFKANRDIIAPSFGGIAREKKALTFWNIRWFGWFRKVIMNYHAVCLQKYDGYLVFVDSDTRFINTFDDEFLASITKGKPISFFKGNRPAIEAGLVVVDCTDPRTQKFYDFFMEMYTSKEFRKLDRWDDGYVLTIAMKSFPEDWFCDFAQGKDGVTLTNSNGHKTCSQVIGLTPWKKYIEHDKGIHFRKGISL